jgi:hypothetical protein
MQIRVGQDDGHLIGVLGTQGEKNKERSLDGVHAVTIFVASSSAR